MCMLSRVGLFSDPMDCSPPGSSVHGISRALLLECFPPLGGLLDPVIESVSPALFHCFPPEQRVLWGLCREKGVWSFASEF